VFESTYIAHIYWYTLVRVLIRTLNFLVQNQSGYVAAIVIGSGIVGAAISGIYVDKTKRFKEAMKLMFVVATGASFFVRPCFSMTVRLRKVNKAA
jgi:hypothetical protein